MRRRIALLLAAASFAVAVAREGPARMANRPPASNETLASIDVRFLGRSVNATPAFTGAVNTALAHSVDWLSMEDLWLSPEMLLEPCAVHPPPCQRLTLRYDISPKLPPTKTAFARLIDAIHNGAIGITLAKLGAPVEGVDLLALTVNDTAFGDRDPPLPPEAGGPLTARFQLKIIGPDALLGGQEMFRVLLLGIASELTSAGGYVSFSNMRIVDVERNATPVAAPRPGRRRRRLLLDKLGSLPSVDVTIEVAHLSASGVRRLYNDIRLLSETNALTTMLTIKGYRIDSCVFGGYQTPDWFTVNGRQFADGYSLSDRATLGDLVPLALTITLPLLAAVAALSSCLWWSARQKRRGRDFWGRATRVDSLAAAVAAARKGDAASAFALLLDPIKSGGAGKGGAGGAARGFDRLASDWKIDSATLEIARDESGAPAVLGVGAASIVYRGVLNGVQDVAIKLFTKPLDDALVADGADDSGGSGRSPRPRVPSSGLRGLLGRLRPSGGDAAASGARKPPKSPSAEPDDSAATPPPASQQSQKSTPRVARQLEELAREVTLMRACRDKNLVSFVGLCLCEGHPAIVSELMLNGNLYRALAGDAGRRFGWARAFDPVGRPLPNSGLSRRIALDVARGLTYLHSRGVVHMDLKSPNVLLSRAWEAKIADYGVSRVLRDRHVSTLRSAVGTLCWAAPEVLLGRPVNEKADIYSFGVLLWELSSGEPPSGRHLRPLEAPAEAPQVVVDTIARCLMEDPNARPAAADLVALFKNMGEEG